VVLANVMHDAYCTFTVPALQQQVQRKESIALIYQNAELMLTCQAVRVGAADRGCCNVRPVQDAANPANKKYCYLAADKGIWSIIPLDS
jgi:hypothetical protein